MTRVRETHRGKPSHRKQVLHEAESFVSRNSYWDKRMYESCNQSTSGELLKHLFEKFGDVDLSVLHHFPEGVVLNDSRGRGISQRIVVVGDDE